MVQHHPRHGHNVFFRDGDKVFRTYFINNRGDEAMGTVWSYLDITSLGRQETWEDSPEGYPQTPRTSGGTGTITTTPSRRLTRSGSIYSPILKGRPYEGVRMRQKRAE